MAGGEERVDESERERARAGGERTRDKDGLKVVIFRDGG